MDLLVTAVFIGVLLLFNNIPVDSDNVMRPSPAAQAHTAYNFYDVFIVSRYCYNLH